jgi:threonine/homoserine/homoserine lactone efflux protein
MLKDLLLVYIAFVIAAGSPGPSTMAIMNVAMRQGRRSGSALAAGVVTMSFCWGLIAATGLSALLLSYAHAVTILKMAGGLYLLWLALKSARSAVQSAEAADRMGSDSADCKTLYRRGILLHLGNPKSVLSWVAIMTLGVGPEASAERVAVAFCGCVLLGVLIFLSYAWLFSTPPMVRGYAKARRWIEGMLAFVFAGAGLRLIVYR